MVELQVVRGERIGFFQRVVALVEPDSQSPQKKRGGIHDESEQIGERDVAQFRGRFRQRFGDERGRADGPHGSGSAIRSRVAKQPPAGSEIAPAERVEPVCDD